MEEHLAALVSGDRERQWAAHHALSAIGPPALAPLLALLDDATLDRGIRAWWVVQILARMGVSAVEPLLLRLNAADPIVRAGAARALAEIGDRRAVEPLIALLGDPAIDVRRSAAVALGALADARAVEPLIEARHVLQREAAPEWTAEQSFAAEAMDEALQAMREEAAPLLLARLADPGQEAMDRQVDLVLLANLRLPETADVFAGILLDRSASDAARRWACYGLRTTHSPRGVEPLMLVLRNADEPFDLRDAAVRSLGAIGTAAVEPLARFLNDAAQPGTLRARAAASLGTIGRYRLGDHRIVDPLIDALGADDAAVRGNALTALGACADDPALLDLLAGDLATDTTVADGRRTIAEIARSARAQLKRRLDLPLDPDETGAGPLLAHYGPILIYQLPGTPPSPDIRLMRLRTASIEVYLGPIRATEIHPAGLRRHLEGYLEGWEAQRQGYQRRIARSDEEEVARLRRAMARLDRRIASVREVATGLD